MIWLLRIEMVGRTWYLASVGCAPEKDGVQIPHHGTLEVGGFAEGIEIGGGITGPCSAAVSFHLGDVEAHDLVLEGHDLADAFGEVSLWEEGTSYAQRYVLVTGPFQPGSIANRGEPIEGEISQDVVEDAAAWPPAEAAASLETWSTLPNDDDEVAPEAKPYPFIFGFPGPFRNDGGSDVRASASPAIIVDDTGGAEVALVAGHAIGATSVRIWTSEDGISVANRSYDAPVSQTTDLLGRVVTVAALSGAPAAWTDFTVDFYATDFGFGAGGGITGLHGTGALSGLGDAIEFLLVKRYDAKGSERIDHGSFAALRPILNQWRIGFYTSSEDGDPIDLISDRLMPMCPNLWLVGGPRGVRPVFLADTPMDDCQLLTEGRDVFATDEPWAYVDIDPINRVTVSFGLRVRTDELRATVIVDRSNNGYAASGYGRSKSEIGTELVCDATYDRGTAGLAGAELLRTSWTKPILMVYDCPVDVALRLELGQRVKLVDEGEGITERLMWVMARATEDGDIWSLTLLGLW